MKIGVVSDIHGNHLALASVLEEASKENVEKLFVLGDIVGYYYHPDKVLGLLAQWDYVFIKGNHEDLLQQVLKGQLDLSVLDAKYGSGHRFAIAKLTEEQIRKLVTADDKKDLEVDGLKLLLCHGSPWDKDLYIYPDSDKNVLDKANETGADIVLIGHSHYQFLYKGKNTILLNAGSVGQSRTTGGVATWAIINTLNRVIQLKSTLYDTTALLHEAAKTDPSNTYLQSILTRNRN
jgi:putative phosphoesterase